MLAAAGETGARIAAVDWAATSLGAVEDWPQSLRTAVGICLHSRFPIVLWWGPDLVMIYNDAYRPILGASERDALGRPGASVWPEVWHTIGPVLGDVLAGRGATWSQDQLLLLDRNGYREERYFTFSHSPVMDDAGVAEGVFTAVTETTDKVVGARRLRTLSDLAATLIGSTDPAQVGRRAMRVLSRDAADVTFAELHLPSGDGFTLLDSTRLAPTGEAAPGGPSTGRWPLAEAAATRTVHLSPPLADPATTPRPTAVVLPVIEAGGDTVLALLVLGISRRRPYDREYQSFLDLLAGHVATALAGVRAYQQQRARAESLAESQARQARRAWATELIGAVSDGVFVSDSNGVVVEVNEAWTRIVGYGRDALPYPPRSCTCSRRGPVPTRCRSGTATAGGCGCPSGSPRCASRWAGEVCLSERCATSPTADGPGSARNTPSRWRDGCPTRPPPATC
jgi:PAS domain-containing protein